MVPERRAADHGGVAVVAAASGLAAIAELIPDRA
jgi:hypothetical protein